MIFFNQKRQNKTRNLEKKTQRGIDKYPVVAILRLEIETKFIYDNILT